MATYKGNDIIKPDQLDSDIKRTLAPRPGLENIEQDLNLPEEAGPDYVPRPGQKGYMGTKPMAGTIDELTGVAGELPPRMPGARRGELPPRMPGPARGELPPRMPEAPPRGELPPQRFSQGGMVTKHGSSTRVSCINKHR